MKGKVEWAPESGILSIEIGRFGHAYWVCPLIEESEALQLQTAQETYEQLLLDLPALTVGLVHGRLKADEKQAVMAAFAAGEIDVLVATTVIEVGVDVPNASLMVIELLPLRRRRLLRRWQPPPLPVLMRVLIYLPRLPAAGFLHPPALALRGAANGPCFPAAG